MVWRAGRRFIDDWDELCGFGKYLGELGAHQNFVPIMAQLAPSFPTIQEPSPVHPDHAPIPPDCSHVPAVLEHDFGESG